MANVAHSTLTGSELHEPKGADTAALGTVYVADGAGSGSWNSIGTSAFTGMIADFAAPFAPTGWLELDGSIISTSTYSGLFAVMSATTSGTRTNGSPTITSIPSTTGYVAGYYVFGTGIASGTTILTVDSPTQITMSGNASSSGTSSFFVSPFLMNTGTITLPDLTGNGKFRRSRTSTTKVGDLQADENKAHTHTITGSPAHTLSVNTDGAHVHTITDPTHTHTIPVAFNAVSSGGGGNAGSNIVGASLTAASSTGISINSGGSHDHTLGGSINAGTLGTASSGSTETRPTNMVVLTCIKT